MQALLPGMNGAGSGSYSSNNACSSGGEKGRCCLPRPWRACATTVVSPPAARHTPMPSAGDSSIPTNCRVPMNAQHTSAPASTEFCTAWAQPAHGPCPAASTIPFAATTPGCCSERTCWQGAGAPAGHSRLAASPQSAAAAAGSAAGRRLASRPARRGAGAGLAVAGRGRHRQMLSGLPCRRCAGCGGAGSAAPAHSLPLQPPA